MENNNLNNNRPVYKKESWLDPDPGIACLGYILCQFVIGAFILYLVGFVYSKASGINFQDIINYLGNKLPEASLEVRRGAGIVNGWGNLFVYLTTFIIVVVYMRDKLKEDFIALKRDWKFHIWFIPVLTIFFLMATQAINVLISNYVPESGNQQAIEEVLAGPGAIPMLISVALFAPIVEELIYRKCIFHYTSKHGIWLSYLTSMILFTLPHMLSITGEFNLGVWLLQCIPYAFAALALSFIYHNGKFNIYTSITVHMANNIMAAVMTYIALS